MQKELPENGSTQSASLFIPYQQILQKRLHNLLSSVDHAILQDVLFVLSNSGKILHQPVSPIPPLLPDGLWGLLPLLVAISLSPEIDLEYAGDVGISVECIICALDLLDDVEDGDQTINIRSLGIARALNVSTILLALAQKAILSLPSFAIGQERKLQLLSIIQNEIITATVGQHQDLLNEQREIDEITEDECIAIAQRKAGTLMRLACLLGASYADASQEICALYAKIGELLGIAHQLDNDCHDLYYLLHEKGRFDVPIKNNGVKEGCKTDLARKKKTLPIVLAAKITNGMLSTPVSSRADGYENIPIQAFDEGIYSAWGISLLYRERAYQYFEKLKAHCSIPLALSLIFGFKDENEGG